MAKGELGGQNVAVDTEIMDLKGEIKLVRELG